MALDLNLEDQDLLATTFERAHSRMAPRERLAELLGAVTLVVVVAALWAIQAPQHVDAASAVICTAVLALSALVRFDTPFGFTVPIQLAFVPLVFAMPAASSRLRRSWPSSSPASHTS